MSNLRDIDPLALEGLATICKRAGISRLKIGEIEMEFGPAAPHFDRKEAEAFQKFMEQGMPSEEDVLMHSAAGYVPTAERPGPEKQPPPGKRRA